MMKRMTTLCFVLIFFGLTPLMAQTATAYGKSDPQAKAVLDAVSKKFKTYSSIKAAFALKIANASDKVLDTKKGDVLLKGNAYRIKLAGQEIYCDGKTIWTYNEATKEVQVNDYQPEEGTLTPAKLFTNFYDKDFLYRLDGTTKVNGVTADIIEMTPLDKSKPFFKVIALVDKGKKNLLSMEIFEKGGNRYTYEIEKFTPNVAAAGTDFVFNQKAHPGVEVVDLR